MRRSSNTVINTLVFKKFIRSRAMKKLTALFLALILMFSLVACGGSTKGEEATDEGSESDAPLLGISMSALDGAMKLTLDNFERVAKEHGWEYVSLSADGDTTKELSNCENLVSLGCDVVIMMVCDSDASAPAIRMMTEAGVKVIIAGRNANVTEDEYYSFVSGDQALGGICQADYVNQWLKDNPDAVLNIGFVRGLATSVPAQIKYDAFVEYCVNNPENAGRVNLVVEAHADAEAEKAYNLTTDWLQVYPEINCFISQADDMSSGIVNALKAQNLDPVNDFVIVSADGTSVGLEGVRSGEFNATVCLSLKALGDCCGEVAAKGFAGEEADKTVSIDAYYRLMTPENLDQIAKEEGLE